MEQEGGWILVTGHICMDNICYVTRYPSEDSTVGSNTVHNRCLKQLWERGGNAANNATVLAKLGCSVEFLGCLAQDHLLGFLEKDMKDCGIRFDNCPSFPGHQTPTSVVISSVETGSRTIIHNNAGLPEISSEHFKSLPLDKYKWIHFEGRNPDEVKKMLEYLRDYNDKNPRSQEDHKDLPNYRKRKLPISVEVEKVRIPLGELLQYADVAFVGRDFATYKGARNPVEAAKISCKFTQKGTLIICPWGDQGAAYCIAEDQPTVKTVEAYPPTKIVDSLGAGDTFDSAVIFALSSGMDIDSSVRFGCKIAGGKLGQHGFKHIEDIAKTLPEFQEIKKVQ